MPRPIQPTDDPILAEKREANRIAQARSRARQTEEKKAYYKQQRADYVHAHWPEERERIYAWRDANPEWFKAHKEKWYRKRAGEGHFRAKYAANPAPVLANNKRWRDANPEKVREGKRQWIENNIERKRKADARWKKANPDRVRRNIQAWKKANPERVKELNAKSAAEGNARRYRLYPERCKAQAKAWNKANPEQRKAHRRNRRARLAGAGGKHTAAELLEILKLQHGRCAICRQPMVRPTVDHVIPIAKGGHNGRRNIQLAHHSCNARKRDKDPIDFMQSLGLLL